MFLGHLGLEKRDLDWSAIYGNSAKPEEQASLLVIAAGLVGALHYGAHLESTIKCYPCERTVLSIGEIKKN